MHSEEQEGGSLTVVDVSILWNEVGDHVLDSSFDHSIAQPNRRHLMHQFIQRYDAMHRLERLI